MATDFNQLQLIEQAKKGSEEAFEALVLSCQNKAYGFAFRYMKNESDTMDVLQEAFIKLYMNLHTFSYKSNFETWFIRIVINCCYDALRKNKTISVSSHGFAANDEEDLPLQIPDNSPSPEASLLIKERQELLLSALDRLPADQKDVLLLREYNNFAYAEIAEILQISEGTVKSRINRAKSNLRDILTEQNTDFFV
jgi:RNA polymerase sigma-70 factor, ECF subfamily